MWKVVANRYVLKEEDKLAGSLADWIFNSHYWIEDYPGYYKCDWCGVSKTSMMSVTKDDPLCPENPAIKKLLR